ncbi:TPR-repeat-containing protein [Fulvivirga imtechensis AK7]|uniref:TPR-repeat-containing protein n=1 Tax=Fulvivirga imtechensis AK7 TaxID=1237149 RepID=L8JJG8_9BACT|nr:tetratricopeptide repeat protein [Fulvivirga imtechensis]ELR69051.1 TPR-repeat-containing protein [Fulvivirga imtechensis AK7]
MPRNIIFLTLYFTLNLSHSQSLNQLYNEALHSSDISFAKEVKSMALAQKDQQVLADSYHLIAYLEKQENNFFHAVINYMEAMKHYRELREYKSLARVVKNLGSIYRKSGFKNTGLKYFYDALSLAKQQRDSVETMYILYDIGQTFWDIDKLDSAILYYQKALEISKTLNSTFAGRIYNDMGMTYRGQGKYELAHQYYELAEQADKSITMRARTLNNRGYAHLLKGDTALAYRCFKQALSLDLNQVQERTLSFIYSNLGRMQTKRDSAIHFYESSFSYLKDKSFSMPAEYYGICKELESQYRAQGNETKALYYDQLQDTFTEDLIELQEKLQGLNMQYQVEAATWKIESDQKAEKLSAQNKILVLIVVALFLTVIGLVAFYYYSNKLRKYKRNWKKTKQDIYNEAKELQTVLKS